MRPIVFREQGLVLLCTDQSGLSREGQEMCCGPQVDSCLVDSGHEGERERERDRDKKREFE